MNDFPRVSQRMEELGGGGSVNPRGRCAPETQNRAHSSVARIWKTLGDCLRGAEELIDQTVIRFTAVSVVKWLDCLSQQNTCWWPTTLSEEGNSPYQPCANAPPLSRRALKIQRKKTNTLQYRLIKSGLFA